MRTNSADVHKKISLRKKFKDESLQQYLLAMRDIGAVGGLEDEAIIKYTIAGIDDLETNKILLYGSTDFDSFKEKLRVNDGFIRTTLEKRKQQFHEPT